MLMPEVAAGASFRPNEVPAQIWRAGQEFTQWDSDDGMNKTAHLSGLLLATDQRLIFLVKKNMLSKNYVIKESMEYGNIANWRITQLMRVRSLQVDLSQGRDRRQVFHNLYEVDPMTLKALTPQTVQQVQELLGRLRSTASR
ncbi:MAG: hypothetical protein MIO90_00440 [Methanomassiliicoccales archaeon]|nr:hypothetical protein [Methanomassiliicoccales archaeon]